MPGGFGETTALSGETGSEPLVSAFWVGLRCPSWEGGQREASLNLHQNASAALWGASAPSPDLEQLSGSPARILGKLQVPQDSKDFVAVLTPIFLHESSFQKWLRSRRLPSAWAHVAKGREEARREKRGERRCRRERRWR